jgi:hypothetical protein
MKPNKWKTKLQLKYEDSDNAIKLTSSTIQGVSNKNKNSATIKTKEQEDDDIVDFDK